MSSTPPKATPAEDRTKEMSFLDHLEELRWRILKGCIGIIIGVSIAFIFSDFFINTILLGPTKATFFAYDLIKIDAIDLTLQSRKLPGQFFTYWGMLFVVGFVIGAPIFFYQLWAFIEPALESKGKKRTILNAILISICFMLGIAFGYLILVPFALQFFTQFQISDMVRNDFDINEYFSSITLWVLACGFIFQIPIVSFALTKVGIITPALLKKYRRHFLIVAMVLGALITPPDPVSMVLVGIPIFTLYELSIWISYLAVKKRNRELEEAMKSTNFES